MVKTSRRYNDEFKMKIAKAHIEQGKSIKAIREEFDISESSVIKWSKEYRNGMRPVATTVNVDEQLQQRIAKLENENVFQRRLIKYLIKELANEY